MNYNTLMTETITHNPTREEFKASLLETFKPGRLPLNFNFADGPVVTLATLALGFTDIINKGPFADAVGRGVEAIFGLPPEIQHLDIPAGLTYTLSIFAIAACAYYGIKGFAQRIHDKEVFDNNLKLYLNSEFGQL